MGKSPLLQLMAGDLTPSSGTISKVRALHLMRQIVQPAHTDTIADLFGIREALDLLARAASGEATREDLADADWMLEERIALALARLDLEACAATPLAGLSGGQRTRAALATIDGALLVVSHDEAFLHEIGIEQRIVLASRCAMPPASDGL